MRPFCQETGRFQPNPPFLSRSSSLRTAIPFPTLTHTPYSCPPRKPRWHSFGYNRHTKQWDLSGLSSKEHAVPLCSPASPARGAMRHHYPVSRLASLPCPSCSLPIRMHLRGASLSLAYRLRSPPHQVLPLLRNWLSCTAGWMQSSSHHLHDDDLRRLLTTLHILHKEASSLPDRQSSDTSPGPSFPDGPVPLSIASRGVGPAGCVPIPQDIWITTAPGGLLLADARTPAQKASNCPIVQAMLDALLSAGLVALHPGLPNAEVFVKRKSLSKAALIINMRSLNANCPTPPPKFRLPTLLEIGAFLHLQRNPTDAPCIATLDLANCFWSIRLPQSNVGCIRVGTAKHTYTLLSLPFGWTHAPAIAQRVVHRYLPLSSCSPPLPNHTHVIQYLDDISIIGPSPSTLLPLVDNTVQRLRVAGFLISPKSLLDPVPATTFIGKHIDAPLGTISALPAYYAGVVLQWLSLATGPYYRRQASRLLGKLIWLAQPRRRILPFLAGPYAALKHGPLFMHRTPPAFTRATLEALAMSFPAWRTSHLPSQPPDGAPRYFADAAQAPCGIFFVGIWEKAMGCRFFPCPGWVMTQQAAELFGALKALSLAAFRKDLALHLYLDNHAAIYSLLRGKSRSPLIPQNRILRRVCYLLQWSGVVAAVHYIPSHLNPADPLSRWWSYPSNLSLTAKTMALGLLHLAEPPGASWGLLAGLQRAM